MTTLNKKNKAQQDNHAENNFLIFQDVYYNSKIFRIYTYKQKYICNIYYNITI